MAKGKGERPGKVTIKLLGHISNFVGTNEIYVDWYEGDKVEVIVSRMIEQFPPKAASLFYNMEKRILSGAILVINDTVIKMPEEFNRSIYPEDKVKVLPVLVGG
ncbi:MoaD/ThiS family protein [Desulfotomaculum nigrificans]|uniref:MoaD/ThiS family protein n=1 Tax=Desulfotomaculum nigrificans TaxID=1565 RepID=UPI0001FAE70E|nr:MoaD/ThiS family protein [Desulfotomaculum nigrificans]